jgi:hypothetical protein
MISRERDIDDLRPEPNLHNLMDIRAGLIDELGRLKRPDLQQQLQECGNTPERLNPSTGCELFCCPHCESRSIGELTGPVREFLKALDAMPPSEQRHFVSMTLALDEIPDDWRESSTGTIVYKPVRDWFAARFLKKGYSLPSFGRFSAREPVINRHFDPGAGALFSLNFRNGLLCYETLLWVSLHRRDERYDPTERYGQMWESYVSRKLKASGGWVVNDVRGALSADGGDSTPGASATKLVEMLLRSSDFGSSQNAAALLDKMPTSYERLVSVGEFAGHSGLLTIPKAFTKKHRQRGGQPVCA